MGDEAIALGAQTGDDLAAGALLIFGGLAAFAFMAVHCAALEAENRRLRAAQERQAFMTVPCIQVHYADVQAVQAAPGPVPQYSLFTVN